MNISLLLDTFAQTLKTGLRSLLEETQEFITGLRYSDGNDENDKNKYHIQTLNKEKRQ